MADESRECPKRRWFRVSLRSLILLVLLIGSAMTLWHNWSAWALKGTFQYDKVSFSPDSRLIAIGGTSIEIRSALTGELLATLNGEHTVEGKGVQPRYRTPVFSLNGEWLAGFEEGENALDRTALFWRKSDWQLAASADGWTYDEHSGRLNRVGTIKQDEDGLVFGFQDSLSEDLTSSWRGSPKEDHPFMYFDPYVSYKLGVIVDKRSQAQELLPGNGRDASDYRVFSPDGDSFALGAVNISPGIQLWRLRRPMQWWGVAFLWEFWLTLGLAGATIWSHRTEEKSPANT